MPLLSLIIILVILGLVLYLLETLIPMDPAIKTILRAVVILVVLLWVLQLFGIVGPTIGHLRS